MKKWKQWMAVWGVVWILLVPTRAWADEGHVWDWAEILSEQEEAALEQECQQLSDELEADILIATSTERVSDSREEARSYILDNGRGYGEGRESILFLINMEERVFTVYEYNTEASGYLLTDDEIDEIIDDVKGEMSAGNYTDACRIFLSQTEYYSGVDFGGNRSQDTDLLDSVWVRAAISLVGAAAVIGIMVAVRNKDAKPSGSQYLKEGSRQIHGQRDVFTHTTVVKRKIETSSNSGGHSSSGGDSGGGHGGSSSF